MRGKKPRMCIAGFRWREEVLHAHAALANEPGERIAVRGTLIVDGDGLLALGGTLEVMLLDGVVPRYGDRFDLFD
jgi:hypothetical protein